MPFSFRHAIFSWSFKKQQCVAQSLIKAEYISASLAISQGHWLRRVLENVEENMKKNRVIKKPSYSMTTIRNCKDKNSC